LAALRKRRAASGRKVVGRKTTSRKTGIIKRAVGSMMR
jgi:hypothetical protein